MYKKNINNDKGIDAILQGVDVLISEKIKQSNFDRTLSGIVTKADYETNTYSVKINEYEYKNIPSAIKVTVNDSVLISCPQNQISQMFICNKIDTTDYNEDDSIYDINTTIKVVDNQIKGILEGTATLTLQLESGSIYKLYGISYIISTGAILNYSTHIIYTSLNDNDVLLAPIKLDGTNSLPYTIGNAINQTLKLTNLNADYETHFALQKIY